MGEVVRLRRDRERGIQIIDPGESAGRVPPHDLDAEAAVLSAVMLDATAMARVLDVLKPEHFYSEANARIFQAVQELAISRTPVDVVSVGAWLRAREWLERCGGTAYLAQIVDATPAVGHVMAHAEIVLDRYEDRDLIATCQRVAAEGYAPEAVSTAPVREGVTARDDWRARARADLGRASSPRTRLQGRPIGAVVEAAREQVVRAGEPCVGVSWGLLSVDELLGPIAWGEQHLIAGRSEMGKTAFACQVAWSIAAAGPDATGIRNAMYVVSGEMPGEALLFRSACSLAKVDATRVRAGIATPDELEAISGWFEWLAALPIIIDDQPAPPAEIVKRANAWRERLATGRARNHRGELWPKCRLFGIVGDHLQDLAAHAPPIERERDELRQVQETARQWKRMIAKEGGYATILLSQLTRAVVDPKAKRRWPTASDLWGGTPVESSADVIVAVHRPEVLGGKVSEAWRGVAGIVPLKGRMGGSRRVIRLGFERGCFSTDLPPHARGQAWTDDDEGSDER